MGKRPPTLQPHHYMPDKTDLPFDVQDVKQFRSSVATVTDGTHDTLFNKLKTWELTASGFNLADAAVLITDGDRPELYFAAPDVFDPIRTDEGPEDRDDDAQLEDFATTLAEHLQSDIKIQSVSGLDGHNPMLTTQVRITPAGDIDYTELGASDGLSMWSRAGPHRPGTASRIASHRRSTVGETLVGVTEDVHVAEVLSDSEFDRTLVGSDADGGRGELLTFPHHQDELPLGNALQAPQTSATEEDSDQSSA
ncbi:hypothetical protein RYH80_18170 [Halobaculum sp. MBLA0147]|uniref:hypothetical protein n=1 Tax=Halobaculum sp. MBLA0147 TaxID=3079934 RepID=UPI003524C081